MINVRTIFLGCVNCCTILLFVCSGALAAQRNLVPSINDYGKKVLDYDWPTLKVGTASYEEGPTGVTVFHFDKRSYVALDVRGGGPGTVNAPYMDFGFDLAELDTIVFAGGSWYGLEATTAVASALKDDGIRNGDAFSANPNIAMSVGSIIFDFGARRLNEIYPDKKLAQAAFRNAKSGTFPLGAYGAGRSAMSGYFFGCNAHSGQGAAFKQFGELKIAAFTVVNAYGAVVDREGQVVACYQNEGDNPAPKISELFENYVEESGSRISKTSASAKNTTISLIVVNQKLSPALLKRLAVQVHTSMARGLQPYASQYDGDVLYAVSTAEVEDQIVDSVTLSTLAGEVMWDAILSSVPKQPQAAAPQPNKKFEKAELSAFIGKYVFSEFAGLTVSRSGNTLFAEASGVKNVFSIYADKKQATELVPVNDNTFMVPGRYPMTLKFHNKELIINPGRWQQVAKRQ